MISASVVKELTNHPEQVSDKGVSIRKCQSEEADERHTLHCVVQQIYKQIIVRTIDTDAVIYLISHLGGFTSFNTSAVNAQMINSSIFYDIGKMIAFFGLDICKTLSFFYAFTGCDIVSNFYGKGSVKRRTRGWAVNTKILTPINFQD